MEIVPLSFPRAGDSHTVGLPFNRRNVEEWCRLDSITGMMEKAKIETDRWSASNSVGAHNFAKVVDSRERNRPDGSLQQRQRKQLEIFQTMVPGGSMQVIRSQTVTSSSSSSQWTSSGKGFGELELPVNHLDLSSQKTKGSVGRSGSISGRRPPSRPRSLAGNHTDTLADVAAQCHRLHEQAKARIFGTFSNGVDSDPDDSSEGVVITELESPSENSSQKTNLSRQKSCSNENVNEENEESNSIRRSSRFRRSLQFPKTTVADDIPDWINGKSLKERAAEIECLLRRGSSTSYEAKKEEKQETVEAPVKVKSSFVSAETLKEVRDRLRKSSCNDDANEETENVRVKDFVSGMEAKLGNVKPTVNGAGTFELRTGHTNNSSEWYRRRKSYGFEKVTDTDTFNGQSNGESSTDSGFGQYSEGSAKIPESPFRRYIEEPAFEPAWTRKSPLPSRERSSLRCSKNPWLSQLRGTKLVDREWFSGTPDPEMNDSGVPDSPKAKDEEAKSFDIEASQKKQKKVEFCKTEVHFAAEPGRFQIIETDGKPPASAVLRRSRRNRNNGRTSPVQNPSGLPEVKFGDTFVEKKMLATTNAEKIDCLSKKIESELKDLSKIVVESLPAKVEPVVQAQNLPKLYDVEEEDDLIRPRSILKNFRKTFLLGETEDPAPVWKSTVVLQNKRFDDVRRSTEERKSYSSDGESELQIRFRNLKRTETKNDIKSEPISVEVKRRSLPDDVLLSGGLRNLTTVEVEKISVEDAPTPVLSVAERIKQAEELKARTYSSKIDFRSGEMTVLQNGTAAGKETEKIAKREYPTWPELGRSRDRTAVHPSDSKTFSNPSVTRFPTKDPPNTTTTTRISINIPCEKPHQMSNKNKPCRSWSFAGRSQPCDKPQSASLVMKTIQDSEILKKVKPVHAMIHKFDSLARPVRSKEQRRKTMPINYKAPKEYTHADLEEELRNFTEDLDKDFKDIYEEEIGSLKGSCKDLKKMFEQVVESADTKGSKIFPGDKAKTLPLANGLKKRLLNGFDRPRMERPKTQEISPLAKISQPVQSGPMPKINGVCGRRSPPKTYDSDDSDLLADEEVRSYMSTGQGGSDSDDMEDITGSRKKSFERIRLQFKRLEQRNSARRKEAKILTTSTPIKPTFVDVTPRNHEPHYAAPPKVASIALRYEDDPIFSQPPKTKILPDQWEKTKEVTDRWEKTSNSSSTMSDNRPRERVSYLTGLSLSEKYSKRSSNSSLDNLFDGTALSRVKEVQDTARSSFRSEGSTRFREVVKKDVKVGKTEAQFTLDELSRAADEIMVAVNGLTDDSHMTSSDDEDAQRKLMKKGKVGNLCTISEGRKASLVSEKASPESSRKVTREKSLSSRATRLLQRANSREASLAQRSSSEDIPANVEHVKKKLVRRPRPAPAKVEKEAEKTCSRARVRAKEKEAVVAHIPRERVKTVSSAAKEVAAVSKVSSRTCQLTSERTERTKPSQRRELLTKADAIAEQSVRSKRTFSSHSSALTRGDPNQQSLTKRRNPKVSLRKVEAARVSQAV